MDGAQASGRPPIASSPLRHSPRIIQEIAVWPSAPEHGIKTHYSRRVLPGRGQREGSPRAHFRSSRLGSLGQGGGNLPSSESSVSSSLAVQCLSEVPENSVAAQAESCRSGEGWTQLFARPLGAKLEINPLIKQKIFTEGPHVPWPFPGFVRNNRKERRS